MSTIKMLGPCLLLVALCLPDGSANARLFGAISKAKQGTVRKAKKRKRVARSRRRRSWKGRVRSFLARRKRAPRAQRHRRWQRRVGSFLRKRRGKPAGRKTTAFAGARAGVEGKAGVGPFRATGRAEGWAGVGAGAKLDTGYKDGKLKLDFGVGAALGVGGKLKVGVEVDVGKRKRTPSAKK